MCRQTFLPSSHRERKSWLPVPILMDTIGIGHRPWHGVSARAYATFNGGQHGEDEDITRSRSGAKTLQMLPASSCVWLLLVDGSLALLVQYMRSCWSGVNNAENTHTEEERMQQDTTTYIIDPEPPAYVALLTVQREVGVSRGTLKKYLSYLGIEPICFHIGTRSLSISREAMAQVKRLKQNPALLAQLPSPLISPGSSQRKAASDDERRDFSDGR